MNILKYKHQYNNSEIEFQIMIEREDLLSIDKKPLYKGVLTIIDNDKTLQPLIQALGYKHLINKKSMSGLVCVDKEKLNDVKYILYHFLEKTKPLDL